MNWNTEQKTAIESEKKRILVSAAAGSGKTAVLVARIERLILKERISLSSMLIVTFTNAAAAEMRQKIVNSLTNRLAKEDDPFLRRQLSEVYGAQISTFHAFALAVIREYYFKTGLAPGLRICDEARRNILRNEAADKLFARRFAEDYDAFTDFLRHYAGEKNEENVRKKMLFDVYDAIRVMPHPFKRLREQTALLAKPARELFAGNVAQAILTEAVNEITKARSLCSEARALLERGEAFAYLPLCDADADGLSALLETAKTTDLQSFLTAVSDFKFAHFSVSDKAEKAKYKAIEADVKRLRDMAKRRLRAGVAERYCARSLADYAAEINDTAPYAAYLAGLLTEFDAIFTREKLERGLMDFADAEHYALAILDDEEVAAAYRERFKHIFIDEYQDSNRMQEALIEKITGDNCLFMVGDVKQSIYKFRLAEPELFLRKYKEYGRGDDPERLRLDLSRNYRSKAPVIDAINGVFRRLMTREKTEIAYDENAELRKGLSFENEAAWNKEVVLCVVDDASLEAEADDNAGDGAENSAPEDAAGDGDEGRLVIQDLQRTEIEALAAVRIVKDELYDADGTRRRFFDTKDGEARELSLRDIVILMRGAKNQADVFARVFAENGLPAFTDTGVGYFDTVEIETFMNLLRVIDNRRRDIPLLSVMYTPIFGFSTEELTDIRLAAPRVAYCDALFACAGAEPFADFPSLAGPEPFAGFASCAESAARVGISARLCEKIRDMLARLEAWRENAAFMPPDEFVWTLLRESGYYTFAGALPGGAQRQANLRALADKALDFRNTHMKGLSGFISYVEHLKKKVDVGQVRLVGEKEDVLRIMTVHKSKGLEFPVVIVAGLGRRFVSEPAGAVSVHKDIGLALRFTDPAKGLYKNTLLQNVIERKKAAESYAEEIRILYVAFTRAMDKLILLGTAKGGLAGLKKPGASIDARSHLELLAPAALALEADSRVFRVCERSVPPRATAQTGRSRGDLRSLLASSAECDPETAAKIERRLGFSYPYEKAASMKSKYAVTELTEPSTARTAPPFVAAVPRFLSGGGRALGAAERGGILHRALERMDFRAAREGLSHPGFLEAMLNDLAALGVFTPEELAAADIPLLRNFLASDICGRAAASPELHKETPFVMRKELDGEEVLVQGVIDCWFLENDAVVLLDYKSGSAFAGAPGTREAALRHAVSRYRPQLAAYAEAIEGIRGARVSEACLFLLDEGVCLPVELP
ncbi:MAG: helicase-exonuclease AddAB subunit AddA [Clostridiales Family XIII bacterium]|jgi:ATP-dependent helicase/nuclease subunit A|nr:helicase-exonuclease AddAB subunit AddA [Clostridiales Family XIII bacterium]